MKTIFESSVAGREGCWPCDGMAEETYIPKELLRGGEIGLPSASELDVVRHFTKLSQRNYGVDGNFYPLGSCTMKYNPKFTEIVAGMPGFTRLHPVLPQLQGAGGLCQGALEVMYEIEQQLAEITGMAAYTMHPMAGAHGELTGVMLMAAYHRDKGNKTKVIVPDSAHGTNPASAAIAGYEIVSIESVDGIVSPEALAEVLDDEVAGMMMTCPNTLGLFEQNLPKVVEMLREVDALLYYDGATSTPSWARCAWATSVSTSFTGTFTRPWPPRTAAAVPVPVRWAYPNGSSRSCPSPAWQSSKTASTFSTTTTRNPSATWLRSTATSAYT